MKKFSSRILGYLTFLFILGNLVAFILQFFLSQSFFYKQNFIVNYLPNGSNFNYIIAGSSRGLTTLNTVEIDKELDLNGFNISLDDTGLPSQFVMIKHYFESGNTADYCVLTLDLGHMEESAQKINDNDYRFVSYSNRDYVWEYFKKYETGIIKPLTLSKFFPVIAFSYYNIELLWPAVLSIFKPKYHYRFDLNGNYSYPDLELPEQDSNFKWESIDKKIKNPILKEIELYLKRNNSKLVIYIAPYYGTKINIKNSEEFQVINHSASLPTSNYFFDYDHVNNAGKSKATELFIKSFKDARLKN
ncbi:hypothetical protein SYJ56_19625 [Algoriphagus sp. D3-2-R+10]|uniref:hypothetical protein n=1 Tax=Algoriphagus aurantiacus TaxID=3103948 RepID=UPI002B3FF8E2|nr:hypothetical protein [Algoriphagus sp. D3-2-R+10]MEB2777535.1 hypothetical protein [Algoriphagus sp. D3-2-R+10]